MDAASSSSAAAAAAVSASASASTSASSLALRVLSLRESPAPCLVAFRAEHRSPSSSAPESSSVVVIALLDHPSSTLLMRLAKSSKIAHPALCPLLASHPLSSIGALPGFMQLASAEQRAALSNKPGIALRSDDRADERTGNELIRTAVKLKPADLLQCTRSLLAALQSMHRAGYVHGLVCPATLLFSPASTVRLSALGAFECLSARDHQALLSSSPYFPPNFTPIDLHNSKALYAADLFAALRSMLDVASSQRSVKGGSEQARQMQALEAAYGSKVKSFFVSAFAPGQSADQLIALVDKAMGAQTQSGGDAAAASSPHRPTALNGAPVTPRPPVPIGAAAAAVAVPSSSAAAAVSAAPAPASFSLLTSTSYPRLVTAAAASRGSSAYFDPSRMAEWRVLRAVFQGTRQLPAGHAEEIPVHVNITADDQSAWEELNDTVQEHFAIKGEQATDPEIPVVLCTSNMTELRHPATTLPLIRSLRASSLQSPSLVILVFDVGSERRIVRNVVEDINFQPHHTMVTEDPGEVSDTQHERGERTASVVRATHVAVLIPSARAPVPVPVPVSSTSVTCIKTRRTHFPLHGRWESLSTMVKRRCTRCGGRCCEACLWLVADRCVCGFCVCLLSHLCSASQSLEADPSCRPIELS